MLKFRAYIKELNLMLYDIVPLGLNKAGIEFGELMKVITERHYVDRDGKNIIYYDGDVNRRNVCKINQVGNWIVFENVIIEQFSNIEDENEKEIYCGDIVTSNSTKVKGNLAVKFIDGAFCIGNDRAAEEFTENNYCTIRDVMFQSQAKTIELRLTIIGNIHSNPELLK